MIFLRKRMVFLWVMLILLFVGSHGAFCQSLRIIVSNGGENWKINDNHYITWQSIGLSADVKV